MSKNSDTPIKTRKELAKRLLYAAELEHQFTCMYLFAAFSLKKDADGTSFNDLGVEITRRWASTIYMVSRQEMEHLAIVNQLLAAIGDPPCFYRRNIPYHPEFFRASKEKEGDESTKTRGGADLFEDKMGSPNDTADSFGLGCDIGEFFTDIKAVESDIKKYLAGDREGKTVEKIEDAIVNQNKLKPADIPFLFTPFDLKASRRYTVMESPMIAHLVLSCQSAIAKDILNWGFRPKNKDSNFDCILPPDWQELANKEEGEVEVGDIERYYDRIRQGFKTLGENIFVPPSAERQVKIINQYNIYLFPITDVTSASNGIDLIIKQGEAVGSSPGFDSHFRHFYDISKEYEEALGMKQDDTNKKLVLPGCKGKAPYEKFQPFFDILPNPQRKDINEPYVLKIFDLFNYGYKTMCYCLTGLYGWYSERLTFPFLTQALQDITFAPTMTLFIRTVGEILVALPSGTKAGDLNSDLKGTAAEKMLYAAPNFDMDDITNNELEQKHAYNALGNLNPWLLIIDPNSNNGDWQHAKENAHYLDINNYSERFANIVAMLHKLYTDPKLLEQLENLPFDRPGTTKITEITAIKERLEYAYQNMYRLNNNLKKEHRDGIYQKFRNEYLGN